MSPQQKFQSRVDTVAKEIVRQLVKWGPASKTGICGRSNLGFNAFPYFDAAMHVARHTLCVGIGKPIIYSHNLDQYGFPEDLVDGETYILRFNAQYFATRAQTMAIQAQLTEQMHGPSPDLATFQHIAGTFQFAMDQLANTYKASPRTQRNATCTGASAKVYLQ